MRTQDLICVGLGIVLATGFGAAQQGARGGEWTRYGGDSGSTKYAPLDQINKDNVAELRVAWRRPAVDPSISSKVPLKPLNLPPLGNPGRTAPLVTKTLLFVGEGDPIMSSLGSRLRPEMPASLAPGAGGRKFRAYDKATGAILWEAELPSGTTGAPMTYMFAGKQYIVVAIGSKEAHSAEHVALSLP